LTINHFSRKEELKMTKVAIGQITPITGDKKQNLEKMKQLTLEAVEKGAHFRY
jgi:predicted amidohydrolase